MKIQTTKTVTEEKEITTPYFSKSKSGDEWYCIIAENICISVTHRKYALLPDSVYISSTGSVDNALRGEPCTQKEFEDAYEKAADYLHTQFEEMRDTLRDRKAAIAEVPQEYYDNLTINGEGEE